MQISLAVHSLTVGYTLYRSVGELKWLLRGSPGVGGYFKGEDFMGIIILDSMC